MNNADDNHYIDNNDNEIEERSHKNDSFKKRYFYKLAANFFGMIINMFTQSIVPRVLGPEAYGNFNFMTNNFMQIGSFIDMNTSDCFYTKLSKHSKERNLIKFYLYFVVLFIISMTGFVVIVTRFNSGSSKLWPGQSTTIIYLAAIWGIFYWLVAVVNRIVDAYALTVSSEITKMLQKLLGLGMITSFFLINKLSLLNYFLIQYILFAFLLISYIYILTKNNIYFKFTPFLKFYEIKVYIKEFYIFCTPLFVYSFSALISLFMDRWILQVYGGSIQQGFFSLSNQIGIICFLFTSAMTPLLIREFSVSYEKNQIKHMSSIFLKYVPLLFSIAAYFSCFLCLQSDKVVYFFGGQEFKSAKLAVAIMAFYPIHQTYGQLCSSTFYATGQTKLVRNIGVPIMLIGIPVTYFLIAPANRFGLNMGALGLVIKMVLAQLFSVNILLYFNAKFLKLKFSKLLAHQFISIGYMLLIGYASRLISDNIPFISNKIIVNFIFSGFIYTIMICISIIFFPIIFGLNKKDIIAGKSYITKILSK